MTCSESSTAKLLTDTVWRPVPRFGLYQICKEGHIKSIRYPDKLLHKYNINGNAAFVALYRGGKRYQIAVNKLVYEAFVGALPHKCYVYPKDGNALNNSADNLFLSTVKLR